MTVPEKHIIVALAVSTTLVLFNIVAVTSGSADTYYSQVENVINKYHPTNQHQSIREIDYHVTYEATLQ